MDRDKILKDGKVELRVIHSGIAQKFEFIVVREKVAGGEVPFLKTEKQINAQELLNTANAIKLPIIAPAGKFFPRGMGMKDFFGL